LPPELPPLPPEAAAVTEAEGVGVTAVVLLPPLPPRPAPDTDGLAVGDGSPAPPALALEVADADAATVVPLPPAPEEVGLKEVDGVLVGELVEDGVATGVGVTAGVSNTGNIHMRVETSNISAPFVIAADEAARAFGCPRRPWVASVPQQKP